MKWRLRIHRARCICSHPTSRYPTTSASVFLSFSFPAPPSQSFTCHHSILLFLIHFSTITMTESRITFMLLLSYTFLDISPTFVVPLIISFLILSSLVTPLTHFRHIVCLLHCPCLGSVHHCWFYNRFVHFPLDPQVYSTITQNPRFRLPVFPIWIVFYASSCTTGVDLLSRRPTHPYSWSKGMGSWKIIGVALGCNAHCDLVNLSYHSFCPGSRFFMHILY